MFVFCLQRCENDMVILIFLIIWLFPLFFGIIDIVWWFFTDHASGIIAWDGVKVFVAITWVWVLGAMAIS